MNYKDTIRTLEAVDFEQCYPLFVPSVLRPAHYLYRNIIEKLPAEYRKKKVFYITRDSWYKKYKESQPDVNVIVIPKEYEYEGYGTDTTRKFVFDCAYEMGFKRIFDWDDDIDTLSMIYAHKETSRRLTKVDREKYAMNILTLASMTSSEAFDKYPRLCLGQLGRVNPSCCNKDFHKTKLLINKGGIPRMSNILNVKRMKKHGMERTGEFDLQMEDMGIDFKVIEKGGWCFNLPTFVHTVPPVEENPRTEPLLHGEEKALWDDGLNRLLKMSSGAYVTYTSTQMEYFGRKRPVGINWNKWNKDHNIESIREEW